MTRLSSAYSLKQRPGFDCLNTCFRIRCGQPRFEKYDGVHYAAFTLLEVLVASAVFALLLVITAGIIGATQNVWTRASSQIEQFRKTRQASEIVARRLSQATLNPYWQVVQTGATTKRFERTSELRFLSAPASDTGIGAGPGSALFFQSPTGFFSTTTSELGKSLNTWGYFIEYGSDRDYRPPILNGSSVPERNRFRLIEFLDPSDDLEVFRHTSGNLTYNDREWFQTPLGKAGRRRVLAENVVAMVALPKVSSLEDPTGFALAPGMTYDSTVRRADPLLNPRNQLPPTVDLAFVVIDDRSANRLEWGSSPPNLGIDPFTLFKDPLQMEDHLSELEGKLKEKGLNARIFRSTVPIISSKWSVEQKD